MSLLKYPITLLASIMVVVGFLWCGWMIFKMATYKPTPEEVQRVIDRVEQNRKLANMKMQRGLE